MLYCVALIPRNEQAATAPREMASPDAFLQRTRLYMMQFADATEPQTAQQATEFAAQALFGDSVIETARSGTAPSVINGLRDGANGMVNLLVSYRPAVTDSMGENALLGYQTLLNAAEKGCLNQNITLPPLLKVRTAEVLTLGVPADKAVEYLRSNLINEVVQEYLLLDGDESKVSQFVEHQFNFAYPATGNVRTIALRDISDADLVRLSKEGLLALDLTEMQAIQAYFRAEGRDPSDVELETLAQTWSEHCVHKTFKAVVRYTELYHTGEVKQKLEIDGLFNTGIARPTKRLNKSWIVSAFSDNAGIISFDDDWDVSFKVETHNHPSALEPFGGANTGLGGVIRDIMAVSAKPIASTDVFCFGLQEEEHTLPPNVLPPKRIFEGVVSGVRDYGNKMGIPTVNGAILFDRGYLSNPLVFCGTVGIAPKGSHPRNAQTGDRIVLLGGRTGRDGIHGATFSSIELGGETAPAGSVVQIGNPIIEKKTLDAILKARDAKLYSAITDCGGGGLSSAVGEMGQELGVRVELDKVPLKYAGLEPWEVWLSEAQERMILAVPPQNLAALWEMCAIEEVEATDLGAFSGDGMLTLLYNGRTVGSLKMEFLHGGLPRRELEAVWKAPEPRPRYRRAHYEHHRPYQGFNMILQKLLADPNIASKEAVIRQYDHEVLGGTVIKPLVGVQSEGHGDAAVMRPFPNSERGIVISNGINPRYGFLDPYYMAACAIDEAIRNAVAVGADVNQLAILDNFCWGNPNVPERLGELTRAVLGCRDYALAFGVPFISGKDSLNNEYFDHSRGERTAIPGTLLISALGVIEDVSRTVTMDLKRPGNLIYIVGKTRPELGCSFYSKYHGQIEGELPIVEAGVALRTYRALSKAIRLGLVRGCHDLSEGGLAVAGAEMAIAGGLGMRLDLLKVPYFGPKSDRTNAAVMFSESPSRLLVEVEPDHATDFEIAMRGTVYNRLGVVIEDDEFNIKGLSSATVLRQRVSELKKAWQTSLF